MIGKVIPENLLRKISFSKHLKNLAENTDCQKVRVEKVVYFQFKSSSNESWLQAENSRRRGGASITVRLVSSLTGQ